MAVDDPLITDAEKAAFYDELRKRADALGFVSIGHALDAAQPAMVSEAMRAAGAKVLANLPELITHGQLVEAIYLDMTKARENGDIAQPSKDKP
jgi:hypothetical protein